jgi:hypothetical protein
MFELPPLEPPPLPEDALTPPPSVDDVASAAVAPQPASVKSEIRINLTLAQPKSCLEFTRFELLPEHCWCCVAVHEK